MISVLKKTFSKPQSRLLTTSEVSTALRPFYFSVHPDLFWPYPQQKTINENSLKQLSAYLEAIQANRLMTNTPVSFYLRQNSLPKGVFKQVTVTLSDRDVRKTVLKLLKACDISTEFVDSLPISGRSSKRNQYGSVKSKTDYRYEMGRNEQEFNDLGRITNVIYKSKDFINLPSWIKENAHRSKDDFEATKATRQQIEKLREKLYNNFSIKEVKWDCGWNLSHIRGCLESFLTLSQDHPIEMKILEGRTVVFGQFTGVSLDGDVFLSSMDVRSNWLQLLKHVNEQSTALLSIPKYEQTLSRVLRDIKIERRKFMPKVLGAQYCGHLRRLITSMGDFYGNGNNFPKHVPSSLANFEIVVEPEAGPLMLTPTGQFITPANCPATELVPFIANNLELASQRLVEYNINKHVKRDAVKSILSGFELRDFEHDDSVTPDLMITCCEKLMKLDSDTRQYLKGCSLYVTNYYSVMGDGVLCIPWDFKMYS